MKCQVGKGRATTPSPETTWSWPCPSSISPRFQDVPLMLTSGSAHPPSRKLRLRDSYDMALEGGRVGASGGRISTFSTFSLPRQPLHWTPCRLPLGSWCQAGCQVRCVCVRGVVPFPGATAHHFRFSNSVKAGGKTRVGDLGGPPAAESLVDPPQPHCRTIKCPWASYITLAYGNFAS